MKSCEEYQELIGMMLDGELQEADRAAVEAHIAACDDCRAMYEAFSAIGGAMELEEVSDTCHAAIMKRVEIAVKAKRTQGTLVRLRHYMTAAACLVVVVGTVLALKNTLLPRRSETEAMAAGGARMMADSVAYSMEEKPAAAACDAAPGEAQYDVEQESVVATMVPMEPMAPAAPDPLPEPAPEETTGAVSAAVTVRITGETPRGFMAEVTASADDSYAPGGELEIVVDDATVCAVAVEVGSEVTVLFSRGGAPRWDALVYADEIIAA